MKRVIFLKACFANIIRFLGYFVASLSSVIELPKELSSFTHCVCSTSIIIFAFVIITWLIAIDLIFLANIGA